MKSISELKDFHKGQTCYIVGKGPSLLTLKAEQLGQPIIALYTATMKVEELGLPAYSMQKDAIEYKSHSPMLLHSVESLQEWDGAYPCYVFDNERDFGIKWSRESIISAIHVAHLFGCPEVRFLAFDASTNGDKRSVELVNGSLVVKLMRGHSSQKQMAEEELAKLGMTCHWA